MDFPAHAITERGVHEAVARQRQLAGKGRADHGGMEVDAVITFDLHMGAGQAGFDQLADDLGIHRNVRNKNMNEITRIAGLEATVRTGRWGRMAAHHKS